MGILTPQFGSIVPAPNQQLLASNYLSFTDGNNDFAQQYLPEIYEQEVERYGNRTLSGFLRMVGAEMPMTSDQVVWSEQNRLHIAYDNCTHNGTRRVTVPAPTSPGVTRNVISPGSTVVLLDDQGAELKGVVTESDTANGHVHVSPYTATTLAGINAAKFKIFVYGSEFVKGAATSNAAAGNITGNTALQPQITVTPAFQQYNNSPIIIRNVYTINGSDMAQIGWVEVATEDGTTGYLWYLKAESETRLRFEDYLEMVCVEGEKAVNVGAGDAFAAGFKGTEGLFAAISTRGNVEVGFSAASGLDDFDAILKNLDTQGAIEENMLFLQRSTALDFDNILSNSSAVDLCKNNMFSSIAP